MWAGYQPYNVINTLLQMTENNYLGELLPIRENNGQKAVNARDLHSFLESKQQFSDWIRGRINKYDFVEGKDFEALYFDYQGNLLNIRHHNFMKSENQQISKIEYALSIGMAKELSMLENNERGKQARKYFIACEENKREFSRKELLLMALQAEEDKERLALENEKQQKQIERLKPKAEFADCIMKSKDCITIGDLANILKQSCLFSKGKNALACWMRNNGYLLQKGIRRNMPTQKSMALGLMRVIETTSHAWNGTIIINKTVGITSLGQRHFIAQFRALLSSKESYEIEW